MCVICFSFPAALIQMNPNNNNNTKHINNSGLAVQPNVDDNDRDRVFGLAENATADDSSQVRRTITMVRKRFCFCFLSVIFVCVMDHNMLLYTQRESE